MSRRRRELDDFGVTCDGLKRDADAARFASPLSRRMSDLRSALTNAQAELKSRIAANSH
jgi:phosphopantetheine adenylyltransferase